MCYLKAFAIVICYTAVHAGELTLQPASFSVAHTLEGHVFPSKYTAMRLDPRAWERFELTSIAEHGSAVKEGDLLVAFKTGEIDQQIADTEQEIARLNLVVSSADAELLLKALEEELPLKAKQQKQLLEMKNVSLKRQQGALADLEQDRSLFEIKAPSDGWFYFGSMQGAEWVLGEGVKALSPSKEVPVGEDFAMFIPATSERLIQAPLVQVDALALEVGMRGFASLSGLEDVLVPVELSKLAETPSLELTYRAEFQAEWPEGLAYVPGQVMKIHLVSHSVDQAITVPVDALSFDAEGWTVEVKLADGKTEKRRVSRGKRSGDVVEITEGLDAGQVIIVP